ncbi:MAG TPA: class I SAM-dependent methyltransferase [Kofleriaceae bacterium]|nr:class I SAM-dependent methyltransferase [Kofleriaceae bacterium]
MADRRRSVPKHYHQVHQLAFSPLLFHAAMSARNMGVLAAVNAASDGAALDAIAASAGTSRYAARVLLEGCLALELVTEEAGKFRISPAGRLWLFDPMVQANANFVHDICYAGAAKLEDSLRTGTPAGLPTLGPWPTIYEGLAHLSPQLQHSWFTFDHYYSDGAFPLAFPRVFAHKPRKLLDVGGNTGKWALLCLSKDPDVELTVLDHPGQLARLRANAVAAGLDARLRTHEIDLLDPAHHFPTGFDVVWMSQVLDCFAEPDIARLLREARAALAPGGRVCVMEAFTDRQPNEVAELCLQGLSLYFACMANGNSLMYRAPDFLALIAEAGLELEADEAIGMSHTLLTCRAR